ncbi:MAG: hypothetical protein RMN52_10220, partial [Anaerolineae bacterium]|nr:hypothetical protein [Candidatus Roseilinea sp.]MDW8450369.1 hypothetical protein [Anaerolineae bacterium]
ALSRVCKIKPYHSDAFPGEADVQVGEWVHFLTGASRGFAQRMNPRATHGKAGARPALLQIARDFSRRAFCLQREIHLSNFAPIRGGYNGACNHRVALAASTQ